MSSFTDPLDVRQVGKYWETLRTITYYSRCEPGSISLSERCRWKFVVPAGFRSDFASIPSFAWPIIGHPAGEYAQAAVLHDYLYATRIVSREDADGLFLEAMKVLGVPWWKRWSMWAAVRVAGGFFYDGKI
jgi:hypothetical protein